MMCKENKANMFFITGLPKSGTTWLMNMLGSLDLVCCLGEGRFFSGGLQGVPSLYDSLLNGQRNWYTYIAHRKKNWLHTDKYIVTMDRQNTVDEQVIEKSLNRWVDEQVGSAVKRLMLEFVAPNTLLVGDKTPLCYPHELARGLRIFTDAKFVYLKRNVKDFIVSYVNHLARAYAEGRQDGHSDFLTDDEIVQAGEFVSKSQSGTFVTERTAKLLAENWATVNRFAEKSARQHGEKLMIVAYEELFEQPLSTMDKIYSFLDIDPAKTVKEQVVAQNSVSAILSGNNRSLKSHIRSGVPGNWQRYLSSKVSRLIDETIEAE